MKRAAAKRDLAKRDLAKRELSKREQGVAQKATSEFVTRAERNISTTIVMLIVVVGILLTANRSRSIQASAMVGGSEIGVQVFGILITILLAGMYVAANTALDLLRPMHSRQTREAAGPQGTRLQALMDEKPVLGAATALASQLCRLLLVWLAYPLVVDMQQVLSKASGDSALGAFFEASLIVAAPILLINLVVSDLAPKSFASLHPHRIAIALYRPIRFAGFILWLPATAMVSFDGLITRRFGGTPSFNLPNQAEEEIKNLVESARETGEIEVDEKELLHSVFEFTDTVAREVMTPRVDMDAMPVRSDPKKVLQVIQDSGHSRIPLYEETDDQIVGIIHAKDLLMAMVDRPNSRIDLRRLMRPAQFVPENKDLHELLREMRGNRNHLVVVQDEFGGTAGIVTVEDIVEQLVGDIVDEYDIEEPEVISTGSGYIVEGKTHLDDVNEEVGSEFESEDFDTIGGFVFGLFGRQPEINESIEGDGYRFTIADTDGRRILKIRIEAVEESAADERVS